MHEPQDEQAHWRAHQPNCERPSKYNLGCKESYNVEKYPHNHDPDGDEKYQSGSGVFFCVFETGQFQECSHLAGSVYLV